MKKKLWLIGSITALALAGFATAQGAPYPPAVGGTGTGSAPLPGQVLIGTSGNAYTPAYILCAGTCSVSTSSGGITITGTGLANNAGNWAGTWQLFNPSDFLPSSTVKVTSVNGLSGVVTITSSSLSVVWPTVNGNQATNYNLVAGTSVTSTVSGATTTLSLNLNNGSAQTCSANQFLNAISATGTVACGSITFPTTATYTFSAGAGISISQATSSSNTTTTVTLNLNNGATQSCSANQFFNSLTATGTASCGSITFPAGSVTTTINGASGPTFNFTASSTNNVLSIASSTSGGSSTIQYLLDLHNYLTAALLALNGLNAPNQAVIAGTGLSYSTSTSGNNATTTLTLNINNGSTQTCSANQFVNQVNATGITSCGAITFPASITSINGATSSAQTIVAGAGVTVSTAPGSSNSTTTITNTGVTSFTGQGCATAANSTGSVTLTVSCISGNQVITFTLNGDATGTATGTTAITDSVTIIGLNGKALPANTTGTLQFIGNAWKINLATSSLGVYDASGTLSSYLGSSCGGSQFVNAISPTGTVTCATPAGTGGGVATSSPATPGYFVYFNPDGSTITSNATMRVNTSTGQISITVQSGAGGSQSTGGGFLVNGTNSTSSAVVWYDNQPNEASGQAYQATCDTAFGTFDCFVVRGLATSTTAFDVQGNQANKGTLKVDHNPPQDGSSDANASIFSGAANGTSTAVQGAFISLGSSTGKAIHITGLNGNDIFDVASSGIPAVLKFGSTQNPCLIIGDSSGDFATSTCVTSVNGSSGAISNVAVTNADNSFSSGQTVQGNVSSTAFQSTSTSNSQVQVFNDTYWVPANFATAGCAGKTGDTDFGACVNDLYNLASSTASSVAIMVPNVTVTPAQWKTQIKFTNNYEAPNLICPGGAMLKYGGTGTAITFNFGNPAGHLVSEDYGCTYRGNNNLLAAGDTNTATTTGIFFGGSSGSVGVNFHDNNVNGFGTCIGTGANTYMLNVHDNAISGCGSSANQPYAGSLLYISPASNSGERFNFDHNSFTDPANSTSNKAIYISDGALASGFFSNNSFDDVTPYVGISNGVIDFDANHFENAAYSTYLMKYFLVASSSVATQININGNFFALDNTGATGQLSTGIEHAVNLVFNDNVVDNYGGASAITNFIDHSINPGQAVETACDNFSINSAVSNWMQLTSLATSLKQPGCYYENGNGYPYNWYVDGGGNLFLYSGGQQNMEIEASGKTHFTGDVTTELSTLYTHDIVSTGGRFQQQNTSGANYFAGTLTLGSTTTGTAGLTVFNSSATVQLGTGSADPGCIEWWNGSTKVYTFPSGNTTLTTTSTKPSRCQ
jgi:hypothetical protein